MSKLKDAALEWAEEGFAIFPCSPGGKTPACFWRRDATTDKRRIEKWWTENPNYNIGLPTGDNFKNSRRIEVLDIDVKNGNDGRWILDHRLVEGQMENAFAHVSTPSGGWHFYFRSADQPSGKLNGVDFKATGGYVLVPPSQIVTPFDNGLGVKYVRNYEFLKLRSVTPKDRPFNWEVVRQEFNPEYGNGVRHFGSRQYPIELLAKWMEREPEGTRNNELFHKACIAIESGYRDLTLLYDAALTAGEEPEKALATIRSAERTYGLTPSVIGSRNGLVSYLRPDRA